MARRGGGGRPWNSNQTGGRFSGGSYSDEHDDRDRKQQQQQTTKRRVSFKPTGSKGRNVPNKGRLEFAIKARLEDDEEMVDYGMARGDKAKPRRKGSPIPCGRIGMKKLHSGASFGWYQVIIPYGQKYDKDLIIRSILNAISPDIFIPHYWRQEKTCVTFYLDDLKIAERLLNLDRTIRFPDGFKMLIRVRSGTPLVNIDTAFKERMKLAMGKRYNAVTKALDLSRFHADPDLKDIFCGLFRPAIMLAVIDIISENIPHLEALNLNENQIQQLDHFKCLADKLPNIKILYLADNRIQSVASFQAFKGLSIIELALKNNPLRQRFRTEAQYISEVRRKFPKLMKLDGQELEPQIVFDVQESFALPTAKASYIFCNETGQNIIRQFLEQYFSIFDSDNRQPLLGAYHEQAMLSMSLPSASTSGKLSNYWQYNRNLLRVHEQETKHRLLRFGRLPCVSFLSELPKTQHDAQSLSLDLTIYTPKLICFTVAGLFKELNSTSDAVPEIRFFQRQFIVVPAGSGYCIRNEMIFISNPTQVQLKTAFKPSVVVGQVQTTSTPVENTVTATSTQLPVHTLPSTSQAVPSVVTPDEATKIQMIQAMATQSNMNLEWSRKCLEENNWDFNHAAFIFDKCHKENRIPAEAFVK